MTIYTLVRHPATLLLSLLVCVIGILSLRKTAQRAVLSNQTLAILEQSVSRLQTELTMAEKALWWAQQPLAQEKVMRDELLRQLPGEQVIQIPQDTSGGSTEAPLNRATTPLEDWMALLRN